MEYHNSVILNSGQKCIIRSAKYADGPEVLDLFMRSLSESDYLLSYPEECGLDAKQESEFLQARADSADEVMLLALIDHTVAAMASISPVGKKEKVKHRAGFGVAVSKEYWGLGIGKALTSACVECAEKAGYKQIELEAVADNSRAAELYRHMGFLEYGRNPMGFISKHSGVQELVYMRLVL